MLSLTIPIAPMHLKEDGIVDISSILLLTDAEIEGLSYLDPDPNVTAAYTLKKVILVS
jgi:hypothetical protein